MLVLSSEMSFDQIVKDRIQNEMIKKGVERLKKAAPIDLHEHSDYQSIAAWNVQNDFPISRLDTLAALSHPSVNKINYTNVALMILTMVVTVVALSTLIAQYSGYEFSS